ncbi:metal ABC transporter substrate-binding protein [Alkalihalobacterium alkalinitrilicum]|uniref:metal ABC transporter substrate-binding protein n=1 Tax=Alkalihalobacterium alkalinitrilicum TaxID=427920 RepID=UPI001EE4B25B|nr:metal ABC transporter substrate-binding protein [Alkalihalobacterium alkalinitrilicum]
MRKRLILLASAMVMSLFLVACGGDNGEQGESTGEGLNITTSFSILGDVIDNVVGDRGNVEYIVPIGEEPHEYEPIPSDFQKVSNSDVFYVNGLGLEEWLEKLVQNTADIPVVTLSEGVTVIPLNNEDGDDPHIWLDAQNVIIMVNNLVEDLVERDPDGEELYRANAEAYKQELEILDTWIKAEINSIPEAARMIAVSEDAFRYFGQGYGIETAGIWELNSHEEGTPSQISGLVDLIQERNLPAVFVETTVDQRYMETVANNAGVEIAGEVYTDAIGPEGSGAESYIKMMEHNVNIFVNGLK